VGFMCLGLGVLSFKVAAPNSMVTTNCSVHTKRQTPKHHTSNTKHQTLTS